MIIEHLTTYIMEARDEEPFFGHLQPCVSSTVRLNLKKNVSETFEFTACFMKISNAENKPGKQMKTTKETEH